MKVRVVRDAYSGYEVQSWRWWLPVWVQMGGCNTHVSLEKAEEYAIGQLQPVIKYIDVRETASTAVSEKK